MTEPEAVEVKVLVADDANLFQVVEELAACGLQVEHVNEETGTVTGKVAPTGITALSRVRGVDEVERGCEIPIEHRSVL